MYITNDSLTRFEAQLRAEERTPATIAQYMRTLRRFAEYLNGSPATERLLHEYKEKLKGSVSPATVNTAIAALNRFFTHSGHPELKLKLLKRQRRIFTTPERELSVSDRDRLLSTAQRLGKHRLYYIIKTLSVTGIRISELRYITVESAKSETVHISGKGKYRVVMLHPKLCRELLAYASSRKIRTGSIFITRSGKPVDRSNIGKELKRLAELADILKKKVFPHNFRHLFARIFYNSTKDIIKLADILGHSSVDTTRIYTIETGAEHRKRLTEIFRI